MSTETPTQRRSLQIDHLSATASDIARLCHATHCADLQKPLGQKDRAKFKKQLEQKLRNTKLSQFIDGTRASQANGITGKTEPLPFRRRSHPLECKTPA